MDIMLTPFSFLVLWILASIVGAIATAIVDSSHAGYELAPQH